MADVRWIKLMTDIFDDEKMALIDGMPKRDTIIVIWFKLLCMAGRLNTGGVFMLNDKTAYTDEMLATIFRRPLSTVRLALKTFEQFGMVDIINNAYTIPNWKKHQNLDKLEAAKEKNRQRVAAHREKQKQLAQCNDYSNDNVTPCNSLDKDKDIDIDIDVDIDKEKSVRETIHTLFERLLPDFAISPMLADKLREWFTYKIERKEPYQEQGMKSLLRQIESHCSQYSDNDLADLIDDSMANGWKGIIFDRLKQKPNQNAKQPYQDSGPSRSTPPSGVDRILEMMQRGDFDE